MDLNQGRLYIVTINSKICIRKRYRNSPSMGYSQVLFFGCKISRLGLTNFHKYFVVFFCKSFEAALSIRRKTHPAPNIEFSRVTWIDWDVLGFFKSVSMDGRFIQIEVFRAYRFQWNEALSIERSLIVFFREFRYFLKRKSMTQRF